jgi:hypothetical protein
MPWSLVHVHRCFGGRYCLCLQCRRVSVESRDRKRRKWRQYFPQKCIYISTRPHGFTSRKILLFIVPTVRTSGLIFFSMPFPAHSGPWPFIQFRNHFSQPVGLLGRVISSSQGLYLNTGQHKHRTNTYTHQTSMLWVGFESMIPAFERAKTVHAFNRAATVTVSDLKLVAYSYIWTCLQAFLTVIL